MEADDQEVQETGQVAQPAGPIQATGRDYRDLVARRIALDVVHFNNVNKEFEKHFTRFRHLEMEYVRMDQFAFK